MSERFKVVSKPGRPGHVVKTAGRWDERNIGLSRWFATFACGRHAQEYCDLLNLDNGFAQEALRGERAR